MALNEQVLCKDCKYCFRSWREFHTWGSGVEWRCKQAFKPQEVEQDPVLGPKVRAEYYDRCSMARGKWTGSVCGPEGRLWSPRNQRKFMFKIIEQEERANANKVSN